MPTDVSHQPYITHRFAPAAPQDDAPEPVRAWAAHLAAGRLIPHAPPPPDDPAIVAGRFARAERFASYTADRRRAGRGW